MEQQAERICRTKATMKERTKACTRKSRNRNRTVMSRAPASGPGKEGKSRRVSITTIQS